MHDHAGRPKLLNWLLPNPCEQGDQGRTGLCDPSRGDKLAAIFQCFAAVRCSLALVHPFHRCLSGLQFWPTPCWGRGASALQAAALGLQMGLPGLVGEPRSAVQLRRNDFGGHVPTRCDTARSRVKCVTATSKPRSSWKGFTACKPFC